MTQSYAIPIKVSRRYLALAIAALWVLGLGVYLFVQVRSAPASTQISSEDPHGPKRIPAPKTQVPDDDDSVAPPTQRQPGTRRVDARRDPTPTAPPDLPAGEDNLPKANPKLEEMMSEANRAYDEQDFDEARAIAGKILGKQPGNIRMLRVIVSSACIQGDKDVAQKFFEKLPKFDRDQMKTRCDRYGIAFRDPPQ
jgi:hypothetical protein